MCRRAARACRMVALIALAAPRVASARQTEAELVRRLDSLAPLLVEARSAARAAAAARRAVRLARAPETVELRVGPVRVLTLPGQEALAREVVAGVWAEYAGWVGASSGFETAALFFRWGGPAVEPPRSGSVTNVTGSAFRRRVYLEEGVRTTVARILAGDFGRATGLDPAWLGGEVRAPRDRAALRRRVATSGSVAVRRCLGGEGGACLLALGLDEGDGYRLDEWYGPAERRLLVRRNAVSFAAAEGGSACLRGNQAACDRVVRARWRATGGRWGAPLDADVRASLVWFALRTGGEGAWHRLIEEPGTPPARALARAARTTPEELMEAWRSWLVAGAAEARADLPAALGGALLWALALGAFSLRSTRWRFR